MVALHSGPGSSILRPFLESRAHVTLPQLSLLLLALGLAGFLGTSAGTTLTKRHLYLMPGLLPVLLAGATLWLLLTQHILWSLPDELIDLGSHPSEGSILLCPFMPALQSPFIDEIEAAVE